MYFGDLVWYGICLMMRIFFEKVAKNIPKNGKLIGAGE